ncbi:MAG: hypothetical protein KME10_19980 [Plectolyngbya sp. WJT66-NPBG17]|jgi:hypothetical protein|nr:hypothetical protein [Plectolyngbya sp. WJT66-NPBG17]MBW4526857.1 hypothetical protein [Phormidium tanganyikae FI6-MK23]
MFGLTKSRSIIFGVSGIVLTGAFITLANQAKAQRLIAQAPPAPPITPAVPIPPLLPDVFNTPSQIGIPAMPSVVTPRAPRPVRPTRRIPIEPVPMPGEFRPPLPPLQATPDLRTMPGSEASILSGISGIVMFTPICSVTAPASTCVARPYVGTLKISTAARDRVIRLNADEQGSFRLRLAPGMYVVEPDAPNFPIGTGQSVSVVSSVMRQMEFNFQGTAPR